MQEFIQGLKTQICLRYGSFANYENWVKSCAKECKDSKVLIPDNYRLIKLLKPISAPPNELVVPESYKTEQDLSQFKTYVMGVAAPFDTINIVLIAGYGCIKLTDTLWLVEETNVYMEVILPKK